MLRTGLWVLAAVVPAAILYATAHRVTLKPADELNAYLWTAMLGAAATAALAALAAFELSQRDRSGWWLLLPLPPLLLWLAATGLGCVGTLFAPNSWGVAPSEAIECLLFITGTSLPLSAALIILVRNGDVRRPRLVGATGGVAIAAAAVSLLTLVHPHDSGLLDILAHGAGAAVVVAANVALISRRPAAPGIRKLL